MEHKRTTNIRRTKRTRRYYDRRDEEERRKLPCEKVISKILVTGSRNCDDIEAVVEELKGYRPCVLVHGNCRGADIIAASVAEALKFDVRAYPADWDARGKSAGSIRNQLMLDSESPIDLCIVFHDDVESSKGTKDMIKRVQAAGIEIKIIQSHARKAQL